MNLSFQLTVAGQVLSWRCDLERQNNENEPPPHGGGYLGARLDTANTEPLDENAVPFGFAVTTPTATPPGTRSPGPA